MGEKTFSNILYLTSACQLRCKYCYEAEARAKLDKDFYISNEELREAIDFFIENNKNNRSMCLFGGEPLLAWDKIEYIVNYTGKHEKIENFMFNIITNGVRLADPDFFNSFFKLFDIYSHIGHKLEISYDGEGQVDRIFADGSSSKNIVLKAIDMLEANKRDFYIRYTLTTTTINHIEYELVYLFEKYKYLKGLTVNIAAENLDKINGDYKKIVELKRPYMEEIYSIYKKPICEFVCKLCKLCKPTDFNMHFVPTIGNKISSKEQGSFDRWNPIIGETYDSERFDLEGNVLK